MLLIGFDHGPRKNRSIEYSSEANHMFCLRCDLVDDLYSNVVQLQSEFSGVYLAYENRNRIYL